MKTTLTVLATTTILTLSSAAYAVAPLKVTVAGINDGKPVPEENVRCKPTAEGKSTDGSNVQPTIQWGDAPKGTKSFAVFVMDPDVPADFSDAGKDGKTIAADAKRKDFFHFASIQIPADARMLTGGNADKDPEYGVQLVNDMGANKYVPTETAYGGPCPPWNDARLHHYHFIVMALDADAPLDSANPVDSADPASNPSTAANTYTRLIASKHVLAKGEVVGTYTLNKSMRK